MFLLFNFVVLVLVSLTLTPSFIYAQTPPRVNLNSTLIMTSSSMSPNLRQNDGVIVGHVPFNSLKIGDIIVFKTHGTDASGHATIVHRVAQIVTEIVTCFFVLGLRIQSAERTTRGSTSQSSSLIDKYFLLLILVSLIPAIIVIIYGIVLIGMYLFGTINTPS